MPYVDFSRFLREDNDPSDAAFQSRKYRQELLKKYQKEVLNDSQKEPREDSQKKLLKESQQNVLGDPHDGIAKFC